METWKTEIAMGFSDLERVKDKWKKIVKKGNHGQFIPDSPDKKLTTT